ncbi:hypothetical protein DPMN_036134 [Dreissena polymorpha]|uniref:Uncharacterized protein n=1 Tax=Dreissena polymorpha TaxID=45954 RepID=A0A9D4RL73_DREPO|nr:hypothetical protein DPMN_036134 [Dreissena polymorpha]
MILYHKAAATTDNSSTTVFLGGGRNGSGVVNSHTYGGVGQVVVAPAPISHLVPCSLRALLKVSMSLIVML